MPTAFFDTPQDWWALLRGVAALNLAAWGAVLLAWWQSRGHWPPEAWRGRRWQLLLSCGYVLGCAWRSLLPVYDVQRAVFVDSVWSSVAVGRSVATVAELCLAAQWALLLREVAQAGEDRWARRAALAIVPMIAVAEVCSWTSVLTTANLGHVIEESLWAAAAALLVVSLLRAWPRLERRHRPTLAFWAAAGGAYVGYMVAVDVPRYWARWIADEAAGRSYLSLAQGFHDVATRWTVAHGWDVWAGEVVWMTSYFSVAVWLSLAMVLAPRFRAAPRRP